MIRGFCRFLCGFIWVERWDGLLVEVQALISHPNPLLLSSIHLSIIPPIPLTIAPLGSNMKRGVVVAVGGVDVKVPQRLVGEEEALDALCGCVWLCVGVK